MNNNNNNFKTVNYGVLNFLKKHHKLVTLQFVRNLLNRLNEDPKYNNDKLIVFAVLVLDIPKPIVQITFKKSLHEIIEIINTHVLEQIRIEHGIEYKEEAPEKSAEFCHTPSRAREEEPVITLDENSKTVAAVEMPKASERIDE